MTRIVGDLLISIPNETNENLLGEKLRQSPVNVEVDAILVLRILILEIVGKAGDGGEFVPCCRIEV